MTKTLLVVDDSIIIFEEMKRLLDGSGFDIIGRCASGEEALEAFEKLKPDIVTMDIVLPGIDGFEAARSILAKYPESKIVMVSSLAYDDTIRKGREVGAISFVYKPLEKIALVEALLEAI